MKDLKFTIGSQNYTATVNELGEGQLEVVINGKTYQVEVPTQKATPRPVVKPAAAAAAPAPAAAPAAPAKPKPATGASSITSPLPGTVSQILVKNGDTVKAGQTVAVVEAMKMQNDIVADADGTVSNVAVTVGAQVQGGDVLIELA